MNAIFNKLRAISGGKLTQAQVDATNTAIAKASSEVVASMLGIVDSMVTSIFGVDLICGFEGKRLVAYDDGVGVWTIGFGTTVYPNGQRVKKGDTCTEAQARQYMQNDLKKFEQTVNSSVTVPLSQNQFDALVSLTYNIGSGAFTKSTLLKKLNAGDYNGAANQFGVWVNAGGKRLQGLVNRRAREKELFLARTGICSGNTKHGSQLRSFLLPTLDSWRTRITWLANLTRLMRIKLKLWLRRSNLTLRLPNRQL